MTTNPGSLRPLSRSTRVAAGIPSAVASTARLITVPVCHEELIQWLTSHQSKTVAADPQLPGPGRMRPTPKKVATNHAQVPARSEAPCSGVDGSGLAGISYRSPGFFFVAPASRRLSGGILPPHPYPGPIE